MSGRSPAAQNAAADGHELTLPAPAPAAHASTAIELSRISIAALIPGEALIRARVLWASLLDAGNYPTSAQTFELLADFQFNAIRDQLIADIPGIDEPMVRILLAQTQQSPRWSRLEWAEQVLLHLYTNGAPPYVAPVLLAVGYISWWQGRGSKALQFMDLALEADPRYQLAFLVRQMIRTGMVAAWVPDKHKAHRGL